MEILTPQAFKRDPSLVWEFHHYLRELVASKHPNPAHKTLADAEKILASHGKKLIVITQNIDGFHQAAGSSNVVELHGNLFKTRCTKCHTVEVNRDSPICEALRGREMPDIEAVETRISEEKLPRCMRCKGLLRPHVVWFGENFEIDVLESAHFHLGRKF
jgi:NAD+-dependent protein deacetylase sirtuin 5